MLKDITENAVVFYVEQDKRGVNTIPRSMQKTADGFASKVGRKIVRVEKDFEIRFVFDRPLSRRDFIILAGNREDDE